MMFPFYHVILIPLGTFIYQYDSMCANCQGTFLFCMRGCAPAKTKRELIQSDDIQCLHKTFTLFSLYMRYFFGGKSVTRLEGRPHETMRVSDVYKIPMRLSH